MNRGFEKRRRSIRLKGYDYSWLAAYFVTICTHKNENIFGEIRDGKMVLNKFGELTQTVWNELLSYFPKIMLDQFCIMPNHVHGIIVITEIPNPDVPVGAQFIAPMPDATQGAINRAPTIGDIVRGFKARCTHTIRKTTSLFFKWQRNYYEHIIRNDKELNKIREYIFLNPINWENDRENLKNY